MVPIRLVPLPDVELVHHLHWRQVAVLLDVQHAELRVQIRARSLFISSHNWEIPNLEVIFLLYTVRASPIVKITRFYFRRACERNTFKLYDA